jgi:hypothetical protein
VRDANDKVKKVYPYQPDYFTSHARQQTQHLSPQKEKPWQGHSSVDANSLMMAQERKFQAHISVSYSGENASNYQGVKPSMPVDEWVHQKRTFLQKAATSHDSMGRSAYHGEAWMIRQAKELSDLTHTGVRNPYNLAGDLKPPKSTTEQWDTKFYSDMQRQNEKRGAASKSYMGAKPNMKEDISIQFAKETQGYVAKPKRGEFQGIRPNTTKDDFVISAYRDVKERREQEDKSRSSPNPASLGPGAFMLEHTKVLAAEAQTPAAKRTRWPFSAGVTIRRPSFFSARGENTERSSREGDPVSARTPGPPGG